MTSTARELMQADVERWAALDEAEYQARLDAGLLDDEIAGQTEERPAPTIRHAGAVERPGIGGGGCWATVRRHVGSRFAQYSSCGNRQRTGCLTCGRHAGSEGTARALRDRLTREPSP